MVEFHFKLTQFSSRLIMRQLPNIARVFSLPTKQNCHPIYIIISKKNMLTRNQLWKMTKVTSIKKQPTTRNHD